jgi:hypothetical protein
VGDLADLLVLLHDAHRHAESVRATIRTWRRPREELAALRQTGTTVYAAIGGPPPEETAETLRLWLQPPDRVREERGTWTSVRRGDLWWTVDADGDAVTNEDDPEVGGGVGEEARWLLDPAGLMGALVLTPLGRGEVAGRPTLRARGVPRPSDDPERVVWTLGIGGADEYELDLDAERGALLRVEARAGGAPFLVHEVTEIAFGERFDPAVFELEPPPGERFRGVRDDFPRTMRHLPIERVAALAPFTVWTPARVPPDWELEATFAPGSERRGMAPAVFLHYAAPDASHQLMIQQSPAEHPGEHPEYDHADPGPWIATERDGRRLQVREPAEDWQPAQVRLELDGTRILVHSRNLDAAWLTDLAAALVPAPTAPP